MAIETHPISINPYAPDGANSVNLYSIDGTKDLTLGQLLCAVCLKSGANQERLCVLKSNMLTASGDTLRALSVDLKKIAEESVSDWGALKTKLESSPYSVTGLPADLNSYDNRMLAMKNIKIRLDELTQLSQQDMVDLQAEVNRRDVAYTTSTNLIRALGRSKMNSASVLTR